jgi:hypothetical protein
MKWKIPIVVFSAILVLGWLSRTVSASGNRIRELETTNSELKEKLDNIQEYVRPS